MLSSLRERWHDSAVASQMRYVGGWVAYGNPAQAYTQLIYLFQGFADLCNQHQIEYWLDWGSLLGYLRHQGGVIPWDYDHDVGMVSKEYHRFITIVEKLQAEAAAAASSASLSSSSSASPPAAAAVNSSCTFQLSDFLFERSGERGYFVMSLASHPSIQIDIVEYITVREADPDTGVERDVLKHNMDDVTYEGFYYPDYPVDMVFPLRRVDMLGFSTLIPRDSDAVTKSHFGAEYMRVLWVPALLTWLWNPFLTRTLWQSPVRDVPVVSSYADAFRLHGTSSPFVVRAPQQFAHITLDSLRAFCAQSQAEVFGYDAAGEIVEGLRVAQLTEDWAADRLTLKVLDSPLGCCTLPPDFVALDCPTEEQPVQAQAPAADGTVTPADAAASVSSYRPDASNAGLSLVLSRSNSYTFLHLDPPQFGGGWMYLVSGRKTWTYISPRFVDALYDPTTRRLRDLPVSELTTRFGYRLHGHVLQCTAEPGDLVYFPPAWMHRVRTYDKCMGVSGYMKLRAAHPQMKEYETMLAHKGLSSIWNGNPDI